MGFGHRFTVATTDVDSVGGRLRTGAQSVRAELDALIAEVSGLTSGSWTGQASAAFSSHYAQLNQGWKQVEAALEGIAQQLRGTAATYSDTEDQIARQFRG